MLLLSITTLLLLYLARTLIGFLRTTWWEPLRIKKAMVAQGVAGPRYRFLHGSTIEATRLIRDSMAKPMELSHDIFPHVQPHLHSWVESYGRNVLTWHGPKPTLYIGDPELVREVLSNRDGSFTKWRIEGFIKKLLGDGLVVSEGKKWAKLRRLANHAFHGEILKGMVPAMVNSVDEMLKKWREHNGNEIDLFKEYCILTSDVISRTAFGSSYIQGMAIFTKLEELVAFAANNSQTIRIPFMRKFLPNRDEIESDRVEQEIRESIVGLIKSREEMGRPDGYGNDFLGLLVKAKHEIGSDVEITLQDVIDECKTFYFGGHETTANLLSWASLLLAINTDWQDKARSEVIEVLGDRNPTSEDSSIAKLKTVTMIINETLRLYPPVPTLRRKATRDARIGDLIIPVGMGVLVSPVAIHHDSKIWGEDAQLFRPERFSEGAVTCAKSIKAFLPFGHGPRICVGQNFAMTEAKVALSMILRQYAFTVSPAYIHSPVVHLTIRPQHGLQLLLHKL